MTKKIGIINEFVKDRNKSKILFTAGPASLLKENITGLRPCFGRADKDYDNVERMVLTKIKKISGHKQIARMQGSASLAIEIMTLNFLIHLLISVAALKTNWRFADLFFLEVGVPTQINTTSEDRTANLKFVVNFNLFDK